MPIITRSKLREQNIDTVRKIVTDDNTNVSFTLPQSFVFITPPGYREGQWEFENAEKEKVTILYIGQNAAYAKEAYAITSFSPFNTPFYSGQKTINTKGITLYILQVSPDNYIWIKSDLSQVKNAQIMIETLEALVQSIKVK